MRNSLLFKVATKSMASRRNLYFPYLLSVSILFGLLFIAVSLTTNEYLGANHSTLTQLLTMGVVALTLISIIIAYYTSRFVTQNQQKELGLYVVLGLERKHIRFILFIQNLISWIITSIFSVLIGYGLGSLLFALLTRMMEDTGATLLDYPFSMPAMIAVITILFFVFLIVWINESWKVSKLNVNELVSQSKKGESEPKSNIFLVIIGIFALIGGYYLALTAENVVDALSTIFIALLLVIIGTYCLFTAGSIMLLKALKRNKKYYYKANHFLSVSGMLYRMKSNAVSLSTIAILMSGIIITLATTLTVYWSMEGLVAASNPYDYQINNIIGDDPNQRAIDEKMEKVVSDFAEVEPVSEYAITHSVETPALLTPDDQLLQLNSPSETTVEGTQVYIQAMTVEDYNAIHQTEETLNEGQILLTSNLLNLSDVNNLNIGDNTYSTKLIDNGKISATYGVELLFIVVGDMETLEEIRTTYQVVFVNQDNSPYTEPVQMSTQAHVNIEGDETTTDISELEEKLMSEYVVYVESRSGTRHYIYQIYGGLLFVGLIVSIALIIGTALLLYFKQISEGYADKENYDIMKKVGLPKETIKSTINNQLFWIFGLPIIVAFIHGVASTKIMNTLLGLLAITNIQTYITSFIIVLVIVAIVYIIFYQLTSRIYYNIVQENN